MATGTDQPGSASIETFPILETVAIMAIRHRPSFIETGSNVGEWKYHGDGEVEGADDQREAASPVVERHLQTHPHGDHPTSCQRKARVRNTLLQIKTSFPESSSEPETEAEKEDRPKEN